jgi:flagellar biosynthesis protein FlhG
MDDQATRLRALMAAGEVGEVGSQAGVPGPMASTVRSVEGGVVVAPAPLTIAVASGKGGVGKTNVAVNLAVAFAGAGHRVTLLDADLGTANADVLCGLMPSARLDHVLAGPLGVHDGGRRTLRDILVEAPGGFRLIPGSAGIARMADLSVLDRRALFMALAELDHDTDLLIIDTAAGVGSGVTSFVDAADTCVVVSTPEPTSVADAYALIKCAATTATGLECWRSSSDDARERRGGVPRFQLVLNQCVDALEARRVAARIGAVCDRFLGLNVPMLGWIAQDVRVAEAVRARQPLLVRSPDAAASRNISALADVLAQQLDLPDRRVGAAPVRGRLASALRRLLRIDASV